MEKATQIYMDFALEFLLKLLGKLESVGRSLFKIEVTLRFVVPNKTDRKDKNPNRVQAQI